MEACPLKCNSMLDLQGIHSEVCNSTQRASMIHNAVRDQLLLNVDRQVLMHSKKLNIC